LSGLRTKSTGNAPTAGRRVVVSITSEPAGVIERPSDANLFWTAADELNKLTLASIETTIPIDAIRSDIRQRDFLM
jgi:hypothetical protein